MSCSATLNGIPRDCEANAGGLRALYFANFDDVTGKTLDTGGAKITAITMATSGSTTAKFKGFYFKPGQATLTTTAQFNEAGEYVGEQAVITVNFGKMDTTKRVQVAALSQAELVCLAQDRNGKWWLLGYDEAVLAAGGESTVGQANTDFNHYGREFHANDNQLPFEVDADAVEAVI